MNPDDWRQWPWYGVVFVGVASLVRVLAGHGIGNG